MTPDPIFNKHEWNAETYHKVSSPQLRWGLVVLDRLRLVGSERVLDVGCGTGRLTEHVAWRTPRGRVIGIDVSANMLRTARDYLHSVSKDRVALVQADASSLPFHQSADVVFSTATFHWVLDHDRLFKDLFRSLKPGGRLVAQCGGGPNLARLVLRADDLLRTLPFAPHFRNWSAPWEFASALTTAKRLAAAGFVAVDTSEQHAPVTFSTAEEFREFAVNVVCRPYLAQLPDPALQARFMDLLVEQYARDRTPYELDYWRLNLSARRAL